MKHKTLYVGYAFSLIALLVMRICQLLFVIEPATGFYKPQYENFWIISATAIVVSALALAFFSYTDIDFTARKKEGIPVAIFSLVLGVSFVIKAFSSVLEVSGILAFVVAALSLILAVIYICSACMLFVGKKIKINYFIVSVVFWLVELISVYLQNDDISAVPQRTYWILSATLCLITSLDILKDKAEMLTKISSKTMVAFSLFTSLFCIISTLPNIILMVLGKGNLLYGTSLSDVFYLFYGIYISVYIFSTFKQKKYK